MQMCSLELKPQIKQEELSTLWFFCCRGREEGRGELFSRSNDFLALGESQPSLAVVLKSRAGPGQLTQRIFSEVVAYVRDLFPWNMEATDLNGTVCTERGWVLFSGSCILKGVVLFLWFFPLRHSPHPGRSLNTQLTCWRHLWCSQTIFSPN